MRDELFALCALGFTMLNSQQVNAQANSQTDRAGDHSTANNYDRLHPSKDNGVEHRFASIFASLKSHFGAGADRQKQDSFASSFKKSVDDSAQSREQVQELQDKKKDKAERDRKVREHREALAEARRDSLEQADKTLAANAEKSVQHRKDLEQQASEMLEEAETKAALRPSDILAAAMAAAAQAQNQSSAASSSGTGTVSGDAAFSGSGSATLTASSGASSSGAAASSGAALASGSAVVEGMTAFSGATGFSGAAGTSGAVGTSGAAVSGGAVLASGSGSGSVVDGAESGSALTQSSVSGAAGMGTGSESGSGNSTASYTAVGLGNDEATPAAQAAAQMLQIDGVETDENLAQSLNQLNRQQVQQAQPHSPSAAEQLASMDGKELRKSLDALARENNVSKLSLKMANPQALAAMRRDAQMLSQLPTSQNTLASLTGTGEATRLHLMANAANGNTNGISAFGAMTGSEASIEQVAATGMRQMEVTGRTSTEILMQQNKLRQESHGLVEKTAMTAAARAEQATKQLESQTLTAQQMATSAANRAAQQAAMGSLAQGQVSAATPNFVGSGAPVFADATMLTPQPQVPNTLAAEVASKAAGMAALGGDKSVASGGAGAGAGLFGQDVDGAAESTKGNAAASAASNADSRAALLRLAMAQDEITTAAMQGEDVSQFADDAASAAAAAATSELQLRPQQSSVLTQAIQSLQQGARPESSGTTYENSILAGMLTANALTEKDLAAAADESARSAVSGVDVSVRASAGTGANFDANSATASVGANSAEVRAALLQDETNAQAMVQEQLQAQAEARAELEREFTNMNFSADPTSDAAMLHERVMRMAARNLKHLAVDLNPRDLGKMRIAIELSDNNDALSVTLAAASPETRALLAHTLPVLEDTLAQQNVATNAYILDLNEIEAEENAEKAVASSAAAVHTLSDPKRIGEQEVAANAANADASENNTRSNAMRWAQSRSVTDGQGRLRGV